MKLLDTHVHVASSDHTRFPLQERDLGRTWRSEPGRDSEGLLTVMDHHGVDGAVLVQAVGAYGYDNSYVLHALEQDPQRLVAVPAIDVDSGLSDAEMAAAVRSVAASPGVVGVRLFAVGAGSTWADQPARARAALSAVGEAGLVAVLTLFPRQLAALAPLLVQASDVVVALDHCAFPELTGSRLAAGAPLLAVRDASNVLMKVSSHLLRHAAVSGHPAELVGQLAGIFGAGRLMWGSDYPQTDGDYSLLVEMATAASECLTESGREGFLGGNADRVFFAAARLRRGMV